MHFLTSNSARALALAAVGILVVWTFAKNHHLHPDINSVDGTFVSAECGTLLVKNGIVKFAGATARMTLLHDKFGLAGELDRPLGPFYSQDIVNGSREPVWLIFDKQAVSTVDHGNRDCVFKRVSR